MTRIRWYGPTLALLTACLIVMVTGPGLVRQLSWHHIDGRIALARDTNTRSGTLAELSEAFRNVSRIVEPSVVHVQVEGKIMPIRRELEQWKWFLDPRHRFDEEDMPDEETARRYRPVGTGSGWVFDEQHIVTNNHVVEDGQKITVSFSDGSERNAKIVGQDPDTDIAVLRVTGGGLHAARLATVPVEQGEIVFAFGSPFGFKFSMSQGIVSAMGRKDILGRTANFHGYENFIQTDAAINRGNSGGPLTNIYGEVVGMNTAIATRGPVPSYNGVGFAIPADMIRDHVQDLIDNGKVTRGFLGVQIRDLDQRKASTYGHEGKGVLVDAPMPGGPADEAGIRPDDIITKLDGTPLESTEQLRNMVARQSPGSMVTLEVFRGTSPDEPGETVEIEVEIVEKPGILSADVFQRDPESEEPEQIDPIIREKVERLRDLGLYRLRTARRALDERPRQKFVPGVIVSRVTPGSVAAEAGIQRRQVITHVFSKRVKNLEAMIGALENVDIDKPIRLRIHNGKTGHSVFLDPADATETEED